jgi:hypothetical protein
MLTDFGLAKIIDDDMALRTACGTPNYVGPFRFPARGGMPQPLFFFFLSIPFFHFPLFHFLCSGPACPCPRARNPSRPRLTRAFQSGGRQPPRS